ncbi:hypothetical protein [Zooshikella harenae]|uniref:FecR protein domain-containing protein n=1 Tax=Zooshikella harenae TaxID=2827238 RepID=A0ABS5ZBP3_9GAMM|nr:hypothetical protein [Zooshikella harenae]MBU2711298.1 hypothetical protein [Zooshikella harenae]
MRHKKTALAVAGFIFGSAIVGLVKLTESNTTPIKISENSVEAPEVKQDFHLPFLQEKVVHQTKEQKAKQVNNIGANTLWSVDEWQPTYDAEGLTYYETKTDSAVFSSLAPGQTLTFQIPQEQIPFSVTFSKQKKGFGDIDIVSGDIPNTTQGASVVKGKLDTHLTIITANSTYTVIVDNKTGKTKIIDEKERAKQQFIDENDGLIQPKVEEPLPPGIDKNQLTNNNVHGHEHS